MNGPANSRGVRDERDIPVHYPWQCALPNPWPMRAVAFACGLIIGAGFGIIFGGVI